MFWQLYRIVNHAFFHKDLALELCISCFKRKCACLAIYCTFGYSAIDLLSYSKSSASSIISTD